MFSLMYFVGVVLIIYFFAFLFVLRYVERKQYKDAERKCALNDKDKVRVRWWVMEDFTGCRGNVHFFDVDLKDFSGGDKLKEVRRQIKKEFNSKVSYEYNWEKIDE